MFKTIYYSPIQAVEDITYELGMGRYVKKRIATYSGGMKRSLAVAVSLLGKPELVLMVS